MNELKKTVWMNRRTGDLYVGHKYFCIEPSNWKSKGEKLLDDFNPYVDGPLFEGIPFGRCYLKKDIARGSLFEAADDTFFPMNIYWNENSDISKLKETTYFECLGEL